MSYQPTARGLYFEEFAPGRKIVSGGRTITEADVVGFAGLSGDYNQIHMDAEFAAAGPFGQRVAHGMLGFSIASGLAVQTGFMEGTVLAFREIQSWKFSQPILLGDTVHVRLEVLEIKALPRLSGGAVTLGVEVVNQRAVIVQHGRWVMLVQSRPAGAAAA